MEMFLSFIGNAVEFSKNALNQLLSFWRSLDEDQKKICICITLCVSFVVWLTSAAYSLGKARGQEKALKEEY